MLVMNPSDSFQSKTLIGVFKAPTTLPTYNLVYPTSIRMVNIGTF
mgnify:CR=1 FL=1|jgi:hypothetical protein